MPNIDSLPNERELRLLEALRNAPELMERFESILALTEVKVDGRIRTADEVEELLIEQTRKLGRETIETWAGKVEQGVASEAASRSPTMRVREKTLTWWTVYGQVSVQERIWRDDTSWHVLDLPKGLKINNRGCSQPLQRVLADFGLEHSFAQASARVREHYGFEIN